MRGNNQSVSQNFTSRMNQYAGGGKNHVVASGENYNDHLGPMLYFLREV